MNEPIEAFWARRVADPRICRIYFFT